MKDRNDHTVYLGSSPVNGPQDDEDTRAVVPMANIEWEEHTVVLVFADNPKALQFNLEDKILLGRRSDNFRPAVDLAPYGGFPAGVSRKHVWLVRTPRGVALQNLGAVNGTWVNGRQLKDDETVMLSNGDSVRFGQLISWLYFENPNLTRTQ